ncbi:MAG: redoxin family protein [Acidobacteria bacterium]|nr:redoxin family protein [Acidobacteriota bacterium]
MTKAAKQTLAMTASTGKRRTWLWAALLVPLAVLVIAIAVSGTREIPTLEPGSSAPAFALPATNGEMITLSDVIAEGDALLYFSMGPGCDGCFIQIPEIESPLANLGIRLVPIMVDPSSMVEPQARRFGIETPILIDSDRSVSEAYDMVGIYGHSDRPSHSFALVDSNGRIKWIGHFAEMFVPFEALWEHIEEEAL